MRNIFRLCSLLLLLSTIVINAQTDPDLEIGQLSLNGTTTIPNGPVQSTTLTFLKDTSNPTGSTFSTTTGTLPLQVTYAITSSNYNTLNNSSVPALSFGNTGSSPTVVSARLSVGNGASATSYTYAGYATPGTGITTGGSAAAATFAASLMVSTSQFSASPNQMPTNAKIEMGQMTVTFSRPVDNPVLHFGGIGAGNTSAFGNQGYASVFDLLSSSATSSVVFSKLSQNPHPDATYPDLLVTSTQITSGTVPPTAVTASYNTATSGSVLVKGKGITQLVFNISIKGDGVSGADTTGTQYASWVSDGGDGDNVQLSVSVQESDLAITKTIDKPNTHVGDTVVFTLTATNNGMSDSPTVVNDLLPPGYTYVNHTASQGTYDSSTGVWNAGIVGGNSASAHPQSVTLNITATVNATTPHSNHTNTATVTGDNLDLVTNNDTASVTPNVIDAVNDTFSIPASGGTSGSILNNDTYNGSGASAANPTITVITPASGTGSLPTLNTTTGIVTVPAGTTPGTYTITYQICKTSSSGTACDQAVITINVTGAGCYNPVTNLNSGLDTKHGITLLKRAESGNGNWPGIRNSAYTVLESNSKGFVITRMTSDPAQTSAANYISNDANSKITNPQEGMMVYDIYAKCLKIYDGTQWSCFSTPSCP